MKNTLFNNTIRNKPIVSTFLTHLIFYPTSANLTYIWSFGSLAGVCLLIQIATGIFLAMYYIPNADLAFQSVEYIMREVNHGWWFRYVHANTASLFFFFIYLHIGKALYVGAYLKNSFFVWLSGFLIFLVLMATAFMGYVLPWGQMSFWAATVITNLFSVLPIFGLDLPFLLWGSFNVGNATLQRFFSLHYFLPFVLLGLVFVHLVFVHYRGSTSLLGFSNKSDLIFFYPYFFVKDLLALYVLISLLVYLVYFNPNLLSHPDNYVMANPLVTPKHIVPEWYFLPFYAILRSWDSKSLGVLFMFLAIFWFLKIVIINDGTIAKFLRRNLLSSFIDIENFEHFRGLAKINLHIGHKIFFAILVVVFIDLIYVGSKAAYAEYNELGWVLNALYFSVSGLGVTFSYGQYQKK